MDRRNFFRSMIGGVAAAAAVRTFPFRVFSFPADLRILNPVVGQTLYTTTAGSANHFEVGQILYLHPDQLSAYKALALEDIDLNKFLVTDVDASNTITIENIPRWNALDPNKPEDRETADTVTNLFRMLR